MFQRAHKLRSLTLLVPLITTSCQTDTDRLLAPPTQNPPPQPATQNPTPEWLRDAASRQLGIPIERVQILGTAVENLPLTGRQIRSATIIEGAAHVLRTIYVDADGEPLDARALRDAEAAAYAAAYGKKDSALAAMLQQARPGDRIPVAIWLTDIDTSLAIARVQAMGHALLDGTPVGADAARAALIIEKSNLYVARNAPARQAIAALGGTIDYSSELAPVICATLAPAQVAAVEKLEEIDRIYFAPTSETSTDSMNAAVQNDWMKSARIIGNPSTIVGVIEPGGAVDFANPYLDHLGGDRIFRPSVVVYVQNRTTLTFGGLDLGFLGLMPTSKFRFERIYSDYSVEPCDSQSIQLHRISDDPIYDFHAGFGGECVPPGAVVAIRFFEQDFFHVIAAHWTDAAGLRIVGGAVNPADFWIRPERSAHATAVAGCIGMQSGIGDPSFPPAIGGPAPAGVGRAQAGEGVAPGVGMVSGDFDGSTADAIAASEWAIKQKNASILNMSIGLHVQFPARSALDRYVDHVVSQYHVAVVAAAGNRGNDSGPAALFVDSPGLAFNAITVGAIDDRNTGGTLAQLNDDLRADYSSWWVPPTTTGTARKPEVSAPGSRVISTAAADNAIVDPAPPYYIFNNRADSAAGGDDIQCIPPGVTVAPRPADSRPIFVALAGRDGILQSTALPDDIPRRNPANPSVSNLETQGTSFAAPIVTGLVADLIAKDATLTNRPVTSKAIVLACAARKVPNPPPPATMVDANGWNHQLGAGVVVFDLANEIMDKRHYSYRRVRECDLPLVRVVRVSAVAPPSGVVIPDPLPFRYAIAWNRHTVVDNATHLVASADALATQFVLRVEDMNLNLVATSVTPDSENAFQIVELARPSADTHYRIIIDVPRPPGAAPGSLMGPSEELGEAWVAEEPTGACCIDQNRCEQTTRAACFGDYMGDGIPCATGDVCPGQLGACCLRGGGCALMTEAQCNDANHPAPPFGWHGPGSTCNGVDCFGACVTGGQGVIDYCTLPPNCTAVECGPPIPNMPTNPCYCTYVCCEILPVMDCYSHLFGVPTAMPMPEPGRNCFHNEIPTEACCFSPCDCENLIPQDCAARGGVPRGPGTNCANTPCGAAQACCKPDGSCAELSLGDCAEQGGLSGGENSTCAAASCQAVPRACRMPDGTCLTLPTDDCAALGGTPQAIGATCMGDADGDGQDDLFAGPGVCCSPANGCSVLNALQCQTAGGRFMGASTTCGADCNANSIDDRCEIANGLASDCNRNGVPDACEFPSADCNQNGAPDACELATHAAADCNANGRPDSCDIASNPPTSADVNHNGVPDECDPPLPGAFTLLSPANGATNTPTAPVFDWSEAANATSYDLVVAGDPTFANSIVSVSGLTASSYASATGALSDCTQYYWRVIARTQFDERNGSPDPAQFDTLRQPSCQAQLTGGAGEPGDAVILHGQITNTGPCPTTYDWTVSQASGALAIAWSSPTTGQLTIQPGQAGSIQASALIPSPAQPFDAAAIALQVRVSAADTCSVNANVTVAPPPHQFERISVASSGAQVFGESFWTAISNDGRYVAFSSRATTLVASDTNNASDVFIRDRQSATTTRVSVKTGGAQASGESYLSGISADGRYVTFYSDAPDLVTGDTNGAYDVFVRDRQTGTTTRVSFATGGAQAVGGDSADSSISADGRFIAFYSYATNLVPGYSNGKAQIYVHDRQTGQTTAAQPVGNLNSFGPRISADGRYVTFRSIATNLVSGDSNALSDIFRYDRQTSEIRRISVTSTGSQGSGGPCSRTAISADGRFVAFESEMTNLVAGDTNAAQDVFLRDTLANTTTRVSISTSGLQGNDNSLTPVISADGRFVAFSSSATNLVAGDANATDDIFIRDRLTAQTTRLSIRPDGIEPSGLSTYPALSADMHFLALESLASNLVAGDTNADYDIFVRPLYLAPAVLGDFNGDGQVTAGDTAGFVTVLLGASTDPSGLARADLNADGVANGLDIRPFLVALGI